ncbi:MAG: hypothetical protein KatS3mg081_2913 [Gemmatimonadales bacterium]|nr:MAG: hypothetical protein KatS3mg081_2913 [Gemmatimonadales bacterium]
MPAPDLISLFVLPLERLGVRYMVTGAVAAVIYGEPRLTRDVDLVLDLPPADAERIAGAFPESEFYVPPVEVIRNQAGQPAQGHFNLIHHETGLKADCYLAGDDRLHRWAMDRRVGVRLGEDTVWVAPIEYVILRKLQWYRDGGAARHLDDIRAMLRVSGERVERAALERWVGELQVRAEWSLVCVI